MVLFGADELCRGRVETIRADHDPRPDLFACPGVFDHGSGDPLSIAKKRDQLRTRTDLSPGGPRFVYQERIEIHTTRAGGAPADRILNAADRTIDAVHQARHRRCKAAHLIAEAQLVQQRHAAGLNPVGGHRLVARQIVRVDSDDALAGARQVNRERGAGAAGTND